MRAASIFASILSATAFIAVGPGLQPAYAEIYNCDGKWTNKPCERGVSASDSIPEVFDQPSGGGVTKPDPAGGSSPAPKSGGPKVTAPKEKKGGGQCADGLVFTTEREKPELDFSVSEANKGQANGKVTVTGTVKGNGAVKLVLMLRDTSRDNEKNAWSKVFTLPKEGGESEFSKTVDLPANWKWELTAANHGTFSGYCSAPGGGKKKEE